MDLKSIIPVIHNWPKPGVNFLDVTTVFEDPADLVDIEAYALAKTCHKRSVNFVCYKFVSDNANESAYSDWASMISAGQTQYIKKLQELNLFI